MNQNKQITKFVTLGSLAAMIAGIAGGVWAKSSEWDFANVTAPFIEVFGQLWVVVLLLLILPIAGSYILYVFISISSSRELGRLGGVSLLVHSANLLIGVAIGLALGTVVIQFLNNRIPVFDQNTNITDTLASIEVKKGWAVGEFSIFFKKSQVLLGKVVLYFIVSSIILSLIISQSRLKIKDLTLKYSKRISEKSFGLLQSYFLTLPVAVFCLLFVFSLKEGLFTAGAAGYLIVILSCLLLILFFVQYIWVAFWGGVSLRHFFKAIIPAQIIAISTRSSLATMPALLDCAEKQLGLPSSVTGVIIPFFVTSFRVNFSVSTTFALIFLAYIFKIELSFITILLFTSAQLLISFGSPGIPSGGNYFNVSLYLAAGIPIEGVLLMKAVDQIPDIFKTLLNVTEVAAVSAVVLKFCKIKNYLPDEPKQSVEMI